MEKKSKNLEKTQLEEKQMAFLGDIGKALNWYVKHDVQAYIKSGWTGKNPWSGRIGSAKWQGYVAGVLDGIHLADSSVCYVKNIELDVQPRSYKLEHANEIALWDAFRSQFRAGLGQLDGRFRKIQSALEALDSAP